MFIINDLEFPGKKTNEYIKFYPREYTSLLPTNSPREKKQKQKKKHPPGSEVCKKFKVRRRPVYVYNKRCWTLPPPTFYILFSHCLPGLESPPPCPATRGRSIYGEVWHMAASKKTAHLFFYFFLRFPTWREITSPDIWAKVCAPLSNIHAHFYLLSLFLAFTLPSRSSTSFPVHSFAYLPTSLVIFLPTRRSVWEREREKKKSKFS